VAGLEHERWALVLVDDTDPASVAVDHLEADVVEVHIVGDRTAAGDLDMRGDESAALAKREQVAVAHARAPFAPAGIVDAPAELERPLPHRNIGRWALVDKLDPRAVRCHKLPRAARRRGLASAEEPQD